MRTDYHVRILADSIGPHGLRLTTFEATFPRFILSEVNTHRMLSRNSASSRAIPTEQQIERVRNHPFLPDFNKRVTGMGVGEALSPRENRRMQARWLSAAHSACDAAEQFLHIDKSRANRLLEPFMWHTAIISGTDWGNFLALRDHEDAQPEFRRIAAAMGEGLRVNHPRELKRGEWHLPLVDDDERYRCDLDRDEISAAGQILPLAPLVSAGRCARVSFDTHHRDEAVIRSAKRWVDLSAKGHWSPGEHPAMCRDEVAYHGNFRGFKQLRKFYPHEEDFSRCA